MRPTTIRPDKIGTNIVDFNTMDAAQIAMNITIERIAIVLYLFCINFMFLFLINSW